MPNARNLAKPIRVIDTVNDSVWRKNDLANVIIPVFRYDATRFWKILETIYLRNQFESERHCPIHIVACNEGDYIVEVVASGGRQNQFVSHEANCLFTS